MAHTTSDESQEITHWKRALLPTKVEVYSLLIGCFLLLFALNTLPVIRTIDGVNYALTTEYIRGYVEKILAPTNNQQGSQILTVLLWMVIGMVMYILVWVIVSLISNYRKDIPDTKGMVLPRGYDSGSAWHETILKIIIRLLSTIFLLYWIYLLLAAILPYTSLIFINSLADFSIKSAATVLVATAMLAAAVFAMFVFARCVVLRERVFFS